MKTELSPGQLSLGMAHAVLRKYEPGQVQWHYEHGLVLQSVYSVAKRLSAVHTDAAQSRFLRDRVKLLYDTKINRDGSINTYKKDEFNLDQINPGKTLFFLYADYKEEKYLSAMAVLRAQLAHHPRTKAGGFWHKQIYPFQMWLDGLYMQGPFYAQYAAECETGQTARESFDDVTSQLILMEQKARDSRTGLLYHAWDESGAQKWANPETGCSPHFWGRALGWYCMALVDTLDFLPADHKNRRELIAIINRLIPAVCSVQDKSGLWYQVLNLSGEPGNYLETSASAMFCCFCAKAVNKGYASDENILPAERCAKNAYEGLVSLRLDATVSGGETDYHLNGICSVAGLGGNPYRDGSFKYYIQEAVVTDDFKGVGPFILAGLELEELLNRSGGRE